MAIGVGAMFSFQTAGEIRFGRGVAAEAIPRALGFGARVLLVHGATVARAGWLSEALQAAGAEVAGFACGREPDVALIEAGVKAARDHGAQVVVSLGGGAVIDAGKAIAGLVPATRPMLDHLEVVGQGLPLEADPLPFIALPSTAGTGAEVTKNAVIGVPEAGRKVSLRNARMLPDLALVDPGLTDGLPRSVTLASGLDAVTQVIEPYVSSKANRMTDALCRAAIAPGLRALRRLLDEGEDKAARDDLAWCSLSGGLALANAGLGAVHGLAGPIGGVSPAPHGAVCGRLLPFVLEENAQRAEGETAARLGEVRGWIAEALGGEPDEAPATLEAWARAAGLPGLQAMGLEPAQFEGVAEAAVGSSSMKGNPVALDVACLQGILQRAG
ncbi:iron-containing alcohol dehydrogenase [Roseovarius sp. MMSF_3281]|uniref:iron-containing alcohol dehydrogenase n=1 Tax=Roseovarius sp. MMSF_3281 TaxID=3046694 RepID=UPI00273FF51F|nr:iron-containing alcohol dehydrogenase [Roseovarius sp. MMSF_3281]